MNLPDTAWRRAPATQALLEALAREGIEARFVGGCVRDALMGREGGDVDLATPVSAYAVMERLDRQGMAVAPTGLAHGTVTIVVNGQPFEITTLRKDIACDGRRAEVEFTDDWREDAARRDFTVNALYADAQGSIYDYFGGLSDLEQKRLRFIGEAEQRIEEDALRILRFFRFQAQLGFAGDAAGFTACAERAGLIEHLSGERIRQEMGKLASGSALSDALLESMERASLWPRVFGEEMRIAISPLLVVESEAGVSAKAALRLAFMLHCSKLPQERLAFIAGRWKLSNAERRHLKLLTDPEWLLAPDAPETECKEALRRLGMARYRDTVLLSWALAHAAEKNTASYPIMLSLPERWDIPLFPVSGDDLLAVGLTGPAIGTALARLEEAWVESGYGLMKAELLRGV